MEIIKELIVPLPPLSLQEKFSKIAQKFERIQAQQREAERQAEHLFQTLLHKAFQGELTPEEVDIPEPPREINYQIRRAEVRRVKETAGGGDAYQMALPWE
jgi:type I restriction enzyme S subunit